MQEFNQATSERRRPTSGRGKIKQVWNLFATFWRSETRVLAAVGLQSSDTKRVATSKHKPTEESDYRRGRLSRGRKSNKSEGGAREKEIDVDGLHESD